MNLDCFWEMISGSELYFLLFQFRYKEGCVCVCVHVCVSIPVHICLCAGNELLRSCLNSFSYRVEHDQMKQKSSPSCRCQTHSHLTPWGPESMCLTRRMFPNSAKSSCFNSFLHSKARSPSSLACFWNNLITVSILFRSWAILAKTGEPKRRNKILFRRKPRRQHFQRKTGPSWSEQKHKKWHSPFLSHTSHSLWPTQCGSKCHIL